MYIPNLGSVVSFEDDGPSPRTFCVVVKYAASFCQKNKPTCLLVSPQAMDTFFNWIRDEDFDGVISFSNKLHCFAKAKKTSGSVILWDPEFDEPLTNACDKNGQPLVLQTNEGVGCYNALEEECAIGSVLNLKESETILNQWSNKERRVRVNYIVDAQFLTDPHGYRDPRIHLLIGSHFHNRTRPVTYWLKTLEEQAGSSFDGSSRRFRKNRMMQRQDALTA